MFSDVIFTYDTLGGLYLLSLPGEAQGIHDWEAAPFVCCIVSSTSSMSFLLLLVAVLLVAVLVLLEPLPAMLIPKIKDVLFRNEQLYWIDLIIRNETLCTM